jgi:hypothetical protein
MLPSQKSKCFSRHLGLSRHIDFLAWQHCFYFNITLKLQHIKNGNISFSGFATIKS